jgi:hypothetical protein
LDFAASLSKALPVLFAAENYGLCLNDFFLVAIRQGST